MKKDKNNMTVEYVNKKIPGILEEVDEEGKVIITKNGEPEYIIVNIKNYTELTEDEKLEIIAKRVLNEHMEAFKKLADS